MLYYYRALNNKGEEITDFIDAPTETAAKQKIKKNGLYIVSIKDHEIKKAPGDRLNLKASIDHLFHKLKKTSAKKNVGLFSRQLATLLKAGMPLMTAINDIIEQIDNNIFKNVIINVRDKIEGGSSFSNALTLHREFFSEMYINMIRVGENLGSLDEVIARLADMEEKKNLLKNKIRAALWYPVFMLTFSTIIVIFLMVNIIPTITQVFFEQNKELPLPTQIVMGISNFLTHFWILIPVFFFIIYYFYRRYAATPEGRKKIDERLTKIPLVSRLYNKIIVYRFTLNLGVLLSNKVDILKSFEIVKKIVNNVVVEEKIEKVKKYSGRCIYSPVIE